MHNCYKVMLLCIVLEKWPKYLFVLIRLLSEGYPLARYLEVGLGKWDRDCRSMTVCDALADGSEYRVRPMITSIQLSIDISFNTLQDIIRLRNFIKES
jgi:hypothetical protein